MTISADDHLPDPLQPESPVVSEPPPLPSQAPAQEPAGGVLGRLDRFLLYPPKWLYAVAVVMGALLATVAVGGLYLYLRAGHPAGSPAADAGPLQGAGRPQGPAAAGESAEDGLQVPQPDSAVAAGNSVPDAPPNRVVDESPPSETLPKRGDPRLLPPVAVETRSEVCTFAMPGGLPGIAATPGQRPVVAVTALVPHQEQQKEFETTLAGAAGYDPVRDVPRYLHFMAERAEVPATAAVQLEWKPVSNTTYARQISAQYPFLATEFVDDAYLLPDVLTMPIPALLSGAGESLALHSKVTRVAGKVGVQSGLGAESRNSAAKSEVPADSAHSAVRPKLLRFLDWNVTVGRAYRYRVAVVLADPNRPENPADAPDKSMLESAVVERLERVQAEDLAFGRSTGKPRRTFFLTTAWSEPSEIVVVAGAAPKPSPKPPPVAAKPAESSSAQQLQSQYANAQSLPIVATNSLGMKLVLIPPGEFLMGASDSDTDASAAEQPSHRVRIIRPFYLGVHEVTQAEYETVMGHNPSYFSPTGEGSAAVSRLDPARLPVEQVSWDEAVEFCRRLSEIEAEQQAGRRYRLPTEAEWEYACRAGSMTPYHFGVQMDRRQASLGGSSPTTVGSYLANAFGLYDMHGNIREWCADGYGPYRADLPPDDPQGPGEAADRVFRGGAYDQDATLCRSSSRRGGPPSSRDRGTGFRVAAVLSGGSALAGQAPGARLPAPQSLELKTKDGWQIHALYYLPKPGIKKGKEVVPVIAVHGWGGLGSEYGNLAAVLQAEGHAVVVLDLRGHGKSTSVERLSGHVSTDRFQDLGPADMNNMVLDIEAAKRFLVEENRQARVNIEMLCVIAAEESCIAALNWAELDWSWPLRPEYKQGRDVKALVLLSPMTTFKRMRASSSIACAAARMWSILIVAGKNDRDAAGEARRLHTLLAKPRPALPKEELAEKQDLFLDLADTDLQGTQLLDRQLPVGQAVLRFLDQRLVQHREEFPWSERINPLRAY